MFAFPLLLQIASLIQSKADVNFVSAEPVRKPSAGDLLRCRHALFQLWTPLLAATFRNQSEAVRMLINLKANMHQAVSTSGMTAIHVAAAADGLATLKVLVELKADASSRITEVS